VTLTRLQALQFIDVGASKPIGSLLGIGPPQLPALKLLEFGVDTAQTKLEEAAGFRGLEFLALEKVGDRDVFESINSPLHAFSVVGAGGKFPIGKITKLKTVELLWLNNLKCELDMETFAALPRLREINVLNCSRIRNLPALLGSKKLESIQFLRCGKPFTPDLKAAFAAKGYQRLEIALA
jgi:hypothetical protein